jgi:large subunit ribosomal protein L10
VKKEEKKEVVKEIVELVKKHKVIGVADITNLPSQQFQEIRKSLRGKALIRVVKRSLVERAIEEVAKQEPKLKELVSNLRGMPALFFSNEDPFRLAKLLELKKTKAPPRAGSTASEDITIPAGPTPFSPGPIIGELAMYGIKSKVEGGKLVITEDALVVKKGERIDAKLAEILARLEIRPVKIGISPLAIWDGEKIWREEDLRVSEEEYKEMLRVAEGQAFSLALNARIFIPKTILIFIHRAHLNARKLAFNKAIASPEMLNELLSLSYSQMLALATKIHAVKKEALSPELGKLVVELGLKEIFA